MGIPINIEELIKGNIIESERIELKKGWNPQSVIQTICAYANDYNNYGGGYIIIGVEEKNGVGVLPPYGIEHGKLDSIHKELLRLSHKITPNYFPIVETYKIDGKLILVIWAVGGDYRPYKCPLSITEKKSENGYFIRKMTSTVRAKDDELLKMIELTPKVTFDNRINYSASIDDLDITQMAIFLKEVNSSLYSEISKLTFEELCLKMNIARGPREQVKPLNVGLLMFSNEPHKFFRGAKIEVIEYMDTYGDKFNEKIFTGPIHQQLRSALSYIKDRVVKERIQKIRGIPEADRYYNYPYEAIEEALSNAVYHKSYEKENTIEVNIRLDQIEILSFPGPMPPVDQNMLKKDKIIAKSYRNSRIGDFLKELDMTEGRGTGIPKIRKFMAQNKSEDPIFETNEEREYFLTILKNKYPNLEELEKNEQISEETLEKAENDGGQKRWSEKVVRKGGQNLTHKQAELFEIIKKDPNITRKKLSEILAINGSAVQKRIKILADKGFIKRVGPDKGGHWEVLETVE